MTHILQPNPFREAFHSKTEDTTRLPTSLNLDLLKDSTFMHRGKHTVDPADDLQDRTGKKTLQQR
jgi:hypothetical protein